VSEYCCVECCFYTCNCTAVNRSVEFFVFFLLRNGVNIVYPVTYCTRRHTSWRRIGYAFVCSVHRPWTRTRASGCRLGRWYDIGQAASVTAASRFISPLPGKVEQCGTSLKHVEFVIICLVLFVWDTYVQSLELYLEWMNSLCTINSVMYFTL